MASSGYTAITFVADELLTSTKMNQMAANDASFNNGNGFEDSIIKTRHLGSSGNLQVPYANLAALPEESSGQSNIITDQSTSSTSYNDLATVGPSVTVTVPRSGRLLVIWTVEQYNSTNTYVAPALSGANTYAATDNDGAHARNATLLLPTPGLKLFTGLNPGSTTVTLKYRVTSGTGNFYNRQLIVVPL